MSTRIRKSGHKDYITGSKQTRERNLKCQRQVELNGTKPLIDPLGIKIITGTDMKKDRAKIKKWTRSKTKDAAPSTSLLSPANRKKMKLLENMSSAHATAHAQGGKKGKPRTILRRKIRRMNVNSLCYITMKRRVRPEEEEEEEEDTGDYTTNLQKQPKKRRTCIELDSESEAGSTSEEGGEKEEDMEVHTVFEDYETFRGDTDIGLTEQLEEHAKANPGASPSKKNTPKEWIAAADRLRGAGPGNTGTSRKETILADGTRIIEELQNVHHQPVTIGLDFFSVHIPPDALEWANQKNTHTNDLSRGVAALIRNASTSTMTVFGIDYNSMRMALGLGPAEIYNILKRALPFSLGIPKCLMSMMQKSFVRYRIRVIPIWGMVSFLTNLPNHIITINDNPLKTTLDAYNQMLGLRRENIGALKLSLARYLKILEYAMHQYEGALQKLADEGVLRRDEYGRLFSDIKVSILNLQSTSETSFVETTMLKEQIDKLELRVNEQQKLIDDVRASKSDAIRVLVEHMVEAKLKEHREQFKREIREELFMEFKEMFAMNGYIRRCEPSPPPAPNTYYYPYNVSPSPPAAREQTYLYSEQPVQEYTNQSRQPTGARSQKFVRIRPKKKNNTRR